ncbi:MAG: hypothetical protein ACI9YL_001092 [Luteibaculaceae bacterium]|jgi:hypothetical protein
MYILASIAALILCLYLVMDKKVQVQKDLVIQKSVDEVWEIMGNQFDQVHLWSTNFKDSKPGGFEKFPGISFSERITITDRGETIQALDSFDPANYSLAYHITKGAPGIAKHASSVWSLKKEGPNACTVFIAFNMETKGLLGFMMTPLIKKGIRNSAKEIAEDLKYYLEHGTPSPLKKGEK